MFKRFAKIISIILVLGLMLVPSALAQPVVEVVTNGGTGTFNQGGVVVIAGQVSEGGTGLNNTAVLVKVLNPDQSVLFSADTETYGNGYYRSIFTLPASLSNGAYTVAASAAGGSAQTTFNVPGETDALKFLGYNPKGFTTQQDVIQVIPITTSEFALVFSGNVNYFNNKNHSEQKIGYNETNEDSILMFKVSNNSQIACQIAFINNDSENSGGFTYYDVNNQQQTVERKRVLIIKPGQALEADTYYKIDVSSDLCANSGNKLGKDLNIYFKTDKSGVVVPTTGGGGGTPAQSISTVKSSEGKEEITIDPTKVLSAMQKGEPLVIDLSTLEGAGNKEVVVNLPQEVIAEAQRQNQDIVLNGPGYSVVIPAGALPANQPFSLSIQQVGGTGLPATPTTLNQMTVYEYNVGEGGSHNFNQALTLSFPVPQGTVNPELLCVYFLNETTGQWEYVGGRIVNGSLTAETNHLSKYMVAESTRTFADITDHWARNTIEVMVARQVISGISDSEFAPDRQITRAEFACLLTRALHQEKDLSDSGFGDVNMSDWYAGYVSRAAKIGLVCGYDGKFNPDATITRQEMAGMIMSAYKYSGGRLDALNDLTFIDKDSVSAWAVDSVKGAYKLGIIQGRGEGLFAPLENASRAEAAVMLKSLMDKIQ